MLKIAICDDEKIVLDEIEKILEHKNISLEEDLIIEKFFSGVELFSTLENSGYFDLIFLDIEMPGLTGLELSQKLRYNLNDKKTQIIFVSAKDKYMKAMFDVAPLKFIQKNQTPDEMVSKDKICEAIDYIIELKYQKDEYFAYMLDGKYCRIQTKDIIYFSSEKRKITIHGKYKDISFYKTFKELEQEIQENTTMKDFIKCNRGLIVNKNYCEKLEGRNLYLADGNTLSISIIAKNNVKAFLFGGHKR